MSLEMNNRALVFQKTSVLLLISSDMHQSVFAVYIQQITFSTENLFIYTCLNSWELVIAKVEEFSAQASIGLKEFLRFIDTPLNFLIKGFI